MAIEPVQGTGGEASDRLGQLARDGIVRPGREGLPRALIETAPPTAANNASARRALLDERQAGR